MAEDRGLLWNSEANNRVHKSPEPVSNLSQINPVQNLSSYFFEIHFDITLFGVVLSLRL
jgi:hypothetical protein